MSAIRTNRLRQLLSSDQLITLTYVTLVDPAITELAAIAGFDAVILDLEHWPSTLETLANHLRAAEARGLATLVRVPEVSGHHLSRVLDLGADGVMAPHIASAADARAFVAESRYPPLGRRGFADNTRGANFGGHGRGSFRDLADSLNADVVVAALIEDEEGAEKCAEIVDIEGIDIVMVGPADLSASMGLLGSRDHPSVRRSIELICDACRAAPMALCLPVGSSVVPYSAHEARALGARLLVGGGDVGAMLAGFRRTREALVQEPTLMSPDAEGRGSEPKDSRG